MSARLGNAALFLGALLAAGCTENPYYIGAVCSACGGADGGSGGSGGADSKLSFAVDLDQTGTSRLEAELLGVRPRLQFLAEKARANRWPSEQGTELVPSAGVAELGLATPFTDGSRAFRTTSAAYDATSEALGDVSTDDLAFELVLRAAPSSLIAQKRDARNGWAITTSAQGSLVLSASDGARTFTVVGSPLVEHAWYHCLLWLGRNTGARIDCNGREGTLAAVGSLGSLSNAARLSLGEAASAGDARLSYFAAWSAATLGSVEAWTEQGRRRFAALTGMLPRIARGTVLPQLGLRDSVANLDLADENGTRRLFLVGPDWPRVACRNDEGGTRSCGYLSEPQRTRWLEPEPSDWEPSELTVSAGAGEFADGLPRTSALVASTTLAPHTLTWQGAYGGARQVLSFFARAGTGRLISLRVNGSERAVFDLEAGRELQAPTGVRVGVEAWGNGLFRCSYAFTPDAGPSRYELELLGDVGATPFAGDGTSAFLELGALQLDVNAVYAGSPLGNALQRADRLSFVASDGNLPDQNEISLRLSVLLPAGPRLNDQALLNLNRGGTHETQVQLYVTGNTSQLKFWGLREERTHWDFAHPVAFTDGLRHDIRAEWTAANATLTVDDVTLQQTALLPIVPFGLDRIDVAFSQESSGNLEGLIGGFELGTLDP